MSDPAFPSDNELVARANGGDDQAFALLYHRHHDWAMRLAYRFSGDREEAFDILQDTFAYFFAKFPGFELTVQVRTFLYPVVKHRALDRRRKRRETVDVDDLADVLPAGGEADPDHSSGDVARLVQRLPELQREVLLLRFADDLSLPQIAAALEVPLGTVKSRLHNAVAALRKLIVA